MKLGLLLLGFQLEHTDSCWTESVISFSIEDS